MHIRPYQERDKDSIISLSDRFSDIPFMEYRNREDMEQKQLELAKRAVASRTSDIFVVEDGDALLGYVELTTDRDYFTNDKVAYISAIAVTSAGEGKGIGKMLMDKAEKWCLDKECKQIVLDVFKANDHALHFYKHFGYEEEIVKMVKTLAR
ncbi:GNAT family N-acetyltransferase [Virgibacillus sp. NKC19-3]|uniref:GNAT family N-acetyltransferase n=1 Tax=Virgibacillus saliphilus TaxID=2831674 RepID=UPI001C9B3B62|nr:GNAT family N-acetyltransferase [Virgibacillus sp. NKC19-3]MBY7144822.1 GNAT family N-acetyltransferase [Virgibacillus sp. NKC19-3]